MKKTLKQLKAEEVKLTKLLKAAQKAADKAQDKADGLALKAEDIQDRLEEVQFAIDDFDDQQEAVDRGDIPSPEQQARIDEQQFSFGVHFERRKAIKKGKSPGVICVSTRYFSSRKEAEHHGKRFTKIHNHVGFDVVRVNKKANAWVNWKTGKTNPAI